MVQWEMLILSVTLPVTSQAMAAYEPLDENTQRPVSYMCNCRHRLSVKQPDNYAIDDPLAVITVSPYEEQLNANSQTPADYEHLTDTYHLH